MPIRTLSLHRNSVSTASIERKTQIGSYLGKIGLGAFAAQPAFHDAPANAFRFGGLLRRLRAYFRRSPVG
jgi:hypothetical protein